MLKCFWEVILSVDEWDPFRKIFLSIIGLKKSRFKKKKNQLWRDLCTQKHKSARNSESRGHFNQKKSWFLEELQEEMNHTKVVMFQKQHMKDYILLRKHLHDNREKANENM